MVTAVLPTPRVAPTSRDALARSEERERRCVPLAS